MIRKIILIGTLITLTLLINGCSKPLNKTSGIFNKNENPDVITMYSEDLKLEYENFISPVAKEITKYTGVKLDIRYPVEGVSDKIDLMISSGEYPDLIMVKDTGRLVDTQAYIDLWPLIEQHAPNLLALYGDHFNRLKFSSGDSAVYVLPTRPVDEEIWQPVMGFMLQHAVVKALDYPILETVSDYERALKDYIKLYPQINGEPSIGISFVNEDWRWKISLGNGSAFATGAPDDGNWYIDPVTHEAIYRFLRPQEKEYYKWLNHMYQEGLIDPDSFVQNYEAYAAKIASGRVLGLIDAKWQYGYGENMLKGQNSKDRMYGQYPVQLDYSSKATDFRDVGYIGGYGIGISTSCEDPVAAIKFLDFLASEEGQVLRSWGIEGVHYYYDVKGIRKFYPEELEKQSKDPDYFMKTGINVYIYPFPVWGAGKKDSTGNFLSPENKETVIDNYTDVEKEVLNAYGVNSWGELYPSKDEIEPSLWGQAWDIPIPSDSPIRYPLEKCDEIMKSGLTKLILSSPELFDEIWNEMMIELDDSGVHEMGKQFTKLVKQRIEFWNE